MRAAIYTQYGSPDVVHLAEVEKPALKDDSVLIKVHAATVTTGDVNMRGFTFVPPGFGPLPRLMFGLFKPNKPILGTEVAGVVEAVGKDVARFKQGDRVFGINSNAIGAHAEYVCWPEDSALAIVPQNVSFEEAISLPFGAGTALFFLRDKANLQPGQTVLVNGASGGTGSAAVQLAKVFGAEVTGVCSTRNLELVKSLGADHVIDYTQEDFRQNGVQYDVIFDTVHGEISFARCKDSLKEGGIYLPVAGGLREMLQSAGIGARGSKKVMAGSPPETAEDMSYLVGLLAEGKLKPLIDRSYPLEEIAEAHRHVDSGRKRGSVIINISPA